MLVSGQVGAHGAEPQTLSLTVRAGVRDCTAIAVISQLPCDEIRQGKQDAGMYECEPNEAHNSSALRE
jgi:hypothetical protein